MHAGGQEFDPPRLHQVCVLNLHCGYPTRPKRVPSKTLPELRSDGGFSSPSSDLGSRVCRTPARRPALFFNNSEICSRIVIQCNNNAGSLPYPTASEIVLLDGEAICAALARCELRGSTARRRCVLVRLGNAFAMPRPPGNEIPYSGSNWRVGLYGQAMKCIWWMPRQRKAMKDVVACDKPRGAG